MTPRCVGMVHHPCIRPAGHDGPHAASEPFAETLDPDRPVPPDDRSDLVAMGQWVADCLDERDQLVFRSIVRSLVAEVERHRNANLVRSVIQGYGREAEFVNEAINADDFDRLPWLIAATATKERNEALGVSRCGECGGLLGADHRCLNCRTQHDAAQP